MLVLYYYSSSVLTPYLTSFSEMYDALMQKGHLISYESLVQSQNITFWKKHILIVWN